MSMRWYVVHAYSGYEKKVALAIQDRVQLHGLQDRFGEILVPTGRARSARPTGNHRDQPRKLAPRSGAVGSRSTPSSGIRQ